MGYQGGPKRGQKSVQNGSKMGSKRGLKSREMVPKMVPNGSKLTPFLDPPEIGCMQGSPEDPMTLWGLGP